MSIVVIGINYKTAPVALREKFYFAVDKLPLYLNELLAGGVNEAVLLSTCNRLELYCVSDDPSSLIDWFLRKKSLSHTDAGAIYTLQDEEAVAHIMRVACGLESMILGEPQILGQMKQAFAESCRAGTVRTLFHRLFQQVFALAKEIRTTTEIGACPVSVASAAMYVAKQQKPDFAKHPVAIIGAGQMSALLLRYLKIHLEQPIKLFNRSRAKALALNTLSADAIFELNELEGMLPTIDVVFSATGSAEPILYQDTMKRVMAKRSNRPILLIDIAFPRDIDQAVADLHQVTLLGIDDLKMFIDENRQGREHAATKAREMIARKSNEFMTDLKSYDNVTHTIRAYRHQIEELCCVELAKAKQQLGQGVDPASVLEGFARAFTQKLLHAPSVQLRQAGVEGRFELITLAKELFAIPEPETERI